jgi:sugar phosphate isomerase/epimerase
MHLLNRRSFFGIFSLAAALVAAPLHAGDNSGPKLGMQSWTLRNLNFEQAVDFCAKHEIKYIQLIPNHLNPNGTKEEWQKKKDYLQQKGVIPYTFGVAGTSMNQDENRKLFECAKFFGMKLIVVEPGDFKILDKLADLAKEYDINVCIHNHGIKSMYGNPLVTRTLLKHLDKHIGVCMDAGWIASSRFDPSRIFKEFEGRVYDIHLKDKKVECGDNGDKITDVFLGEGDANLKKLIHTLQDEKWDGVLAIETDNNLKDPTEHTVKAIEFFKAAQK